MGEDSYYKKERKKERKKGGRKERGKDAIRRKKVLKLTVRLRSIKIQQVCRSSSTNRSPRKASLSPTAFKPTWIFFKTAVNSSVCNFSSDLGPSFSVPVAFTSAAKDTICSLCCLCTKEWILSSHITWLRQEKHYSVSFLVMTNVIIIIIIIYSLTARVVGAPQMISQPDSSIFLCSPLPSETWRTPGLSIPWCCLPTSSSVFLVFFPLSLCLARWFWPDLMNGRRDHTTAVWVSLQWSRGRRVVQLRAGSWTEILC